MHGTGRAGPEGDGDGVGLSGVDGEAGGGAAGWNPGEGRGSLAEGGGRAVDGVEERLEADRVNLRTAGVGVPVLVTTAAVPAARVVTEPMVSVAAGPVGPEGPTTPAWASRDQAELDAAGWTPELLAIAIHVEPW